MTATTLPHILDTVPQTLIQEFGVLPANASLFFSGGLHSSPDSGGVTSQSLDDAELFERISGKKFIILDDLPLIKGATDFINQSHGGDIVSPQERAGRISYKAGGLLSALFAHSTNGSMFSVSLQDPHPMALFRKVELPILMRKKNLTGVNVITRDANGAFHETLLDKSRWFEQSRNEWLDRSIEEATLSHRLFDEGRLPGPVYLSAVKRMEAEINESLLYLKQADSFEARLNEQKRLARALQAAKTLPELSNFVAKNEKKIALN